MRHLKITTAELAEICRVSQGTVDRALNNRPGIKNETRKRILSTAKLYGYREHISGTANDGISGQIGLIVFDLNNEYFSSLIMEIERLLTQMGLCAVVMMTHYDQTREIECIRNMYNIGVKGIVLWSVNSGDEFNSYLKMFDIPIVAAGNNTGGIPYVGIDDFAAMRDMTLYLLNTGYTNLVYFSPALRYPNAYAQKLRYDGFLSAAGAAHTVVTDISEISNSYGEDTAIICSTDYYAFQVYLKNKNVKITGFDNLDAIERYGINIDSVGYSVPEIAKAAIDIIVSEKTSGVIVDHRIVKHNQTF